MSPGNSHGKIKKPGYFLLPRSRRDWNGKNPPGSSAHSTRGPEIGGFDASARCLPPAPDVPGFRRFAYDTENLRF